MREERRPSKKPETVEIPEGLSSFLADVHRMILEESEDATIESDDLLHNELRIVVLRVASFHQGFC